VPSSKADYCRLAHYSRGDWLDFHKLTSHYSGGPMVDIKPQAGAGFQRRYASEEEFGDTCFPCMCFPSETTKIIFAPIWI
jgi:hypothetical protein